MDGNVMFARVCACVRALLCRPTCLSACSNQLWINLYFYESWYDDHGDTLFNFIQCTL